MLTYLLEVTICWTLLYAIYACALSRETFFKSNRAYLLAAIIGGLLIPFLELPQAETTENAAVYLQTVVVVGMEAVEISARQTQLAPTVGLTDVLLGLYFLVVLLLTGRFIYGLRQIFQLYKNAERLENNTLLTTEQHPPFSFLHLLFLPQDFDLKDSENQKILRHERAHLAQRHTLDVLLLELLSIVFWCAPPIYFFKKSLRQIHEYLADAEVLKNTKKKQYGLLLLRQSHQGRMWLSLANHFNQSQLKKRIMMMTKKPSNKQAKWKYLAVIPAFLLLVFAFADRGDKAEFSIFPIMQNDFDRAAIEAEFNNLFKIFNNLPVGEKAKITADLENRFAELMTKYPQHRDEVIFIAETAANNFGVPVAMVNVKAENGTLPEMVLLNESDDPIFKVVDEMPRFPGCEEKPDLKEKESCAQAEMLNFVYTNIIYPEQARDADVQGTVVVRFVVSADGSITKPEVLRSIGGGCDEEVLRIVGEMPNWIPGKNDGKAVAVQYNLPVKFKLADEETESKASESDTDAADEMPRFPGCEDNTDASERNNCAQSEMLNFIYTNIKYPEEAREANVQGVVVSKFTVAADGTVKNAEIVRSIGGGCDEAVLEVIAQMPKWIPAVKDGENIAADYHLPVKFKLADEPETAQPQPDKENTLCWDVGLTLDNFIISPNPNDGEFRLQFESDKKDLRLTILDDDGALYDRSLPNFSGTFDEKINVQSKHSFVTVVVIDQKTNKGTMQRVVMQK